MPSLLPRVRRPALVAAAASARPLTLAAVWTAFVLGAAGTLGSETARAVVRALAAVAARAVGAGD